MVRKRFPFAAVISAIALWAPAAEAEIRIGVAGPMTGAQSWFGEQFERGARMAAANLDGNGGVLGQEVEIVVGDDFCDPDQAIAAADKLVGDGVVLVIGHWCSHSSIAASAVYEQARVIMITPGSASAKLTDEGGPNVFRVYGRDDRQGAMVGDYLAEHWADQEIAILDDGTTWGVGVAGGVRQSLHERGVPVALNETYSRDQLEYSELVAKMQAAGIDILFVGGLHREAGLIFRQAHDRGYDLQLIAASSMATEDFALIAGPELEGTLMIATADMRESPQAAEAVARFRAEGYEPLGTTLNAYAAVQVWADAVSAAGSLDFDAVTEVMHGRRFETVLGQIGFDEKGDVTGFQPWQWFVWQADGTYVPLEPAAKH
jgi:branched-chain amino acid transport system substrate-binding protein